MVTRNVLILEQKHWQHQKINKNNRLFSTIPDKFADFIENTKVCMNPDPAEFLYTPLGRFTQNFIQDLSGGSNYYMASLVSGLDESNPAL